MSWVGSLQLSLPSRFSCNASGRNTSTGMIPFQKSSYPPGQLGGRSWANSALIPFHGSLLTVRSQSLSANFTVSVMHLKWPMGESCTFDNFTRIFRYLSSLSLPRQELLHSQVSPSRGSSCVGCCCCLTCIFFSQDFIIPMNQFYVWSDSAVVLTWLLRG